MGSIRKPESIAKIVKTTAATLSLPASTLNIGAMQYITTTSLSLNIGTIGLGGVDAAVQASSIYTVYAVVSSGTVYLIGSLNSSLPSGYTQARAVGGFNTNGASQIVQVASTSGDLSVAGSITTLNGLIADNVPYQNRLINGGFDFWQRKITGTSGYVADRWWLQVSGSATFAQVSDTKYGTKYAASITADSGVPISSYTLIRSPMETVEVITLAGKMVTISAYIKRNSTFNAGSTILGWEWGTGIDESNPNGGTFSHTQIDYSQLSTTDYTFVTFTALLPSNATSLSPTFGWYLNSTVVPSGSQIIVKNAMLNEGSIAAPFRRAGGTIGGELALCQRYYEKSYGQDVVPGTANSLAGSHILIAQQYGSNYCPVGYLPFKVTKRVNAVTSGVVYDAVTGSGTIIKSLLGAYQQNYYIANNDSGFWVQGANFGSATDYYRVHFVADYEL